MITSASSAVAAIAPRKICRKCSKPFGGVRCLDCEKIVKAAYRKANKDRIKACDVAYNIAHAEDRRSYQMQYRKENPEKAAAAVRKSMLTTGYTQDPAMLAASKRKWRLANLDACRAYNHNRAARIKATGGKLSRGIAGTLKILQRGMCANCAAKLSKTGYHLDHVMPLALDGGNTDANMQLLCPPCNLKKNAKHPIDWAREQGRLL